MSPRPNNPNPRRPVRRTSQDRTSAYSERSYSQLRLLSRLEVEEQFGIPKRYLETSIARGEGPPFVRIGRLVRYRAFDVEDWISSVRQVPDTSERSVA